MGSHQHFSTLVLQCPSWGQTDEDGSDSTQASFLLNSREVVWGKVPADFKSLPREFLATQWVGDLSLLAFSTSRGSVWSLVAAS